MADDVSSLLDTIDPAKNPGAFEGAPSGPQLSAQTEVDNLLDKLDPRVSGWGGGFDQQPEQAESSATGAFARAAERSAAPTVGGLAGASSGASLGAELGEVAGPVGALAGGLVGGVAGSILGSGAVDAAQSWVVSKLPEGVQNLFGGTPKQAEADWEQHGLASILGGVAPYLLTASPGFAAHEAPEAATALQRIMTNKYVTAAAGGLTMGGITLGQEVVQGEKPDWVDVGVSTALGTFWSRPNALGERIMGPGHAAGARLGQQITGRTPPAPVPGAPPTPQNVTLADAGDLKVGPAPGVTDDVSTGQAEMAPAAEAAVQEAKRQESAVTEPPKPVSPVEQARVAEPEAFQEYEGLEHRREAFLAMADDAHEAGDKEGADAAAQHLTATEARMDALAPSIRDAISRVAESKGSETVEPAAPIEHAPELASDDMKRSISDDVARQLQAAGRPEDEARASGDLIAARYATRATVMNGEIGTAEDLYRREGAVIRGGDGTPRRVKPESENPAERIMPLPVEANDAVKEALTRSADSEPDPQEAVDRMIADGSAADATLEPSQASAPARVRRARAKVEATPNEIATARADIEERGREETRIPAEPAGETDQQRRERINDAYRRGLAGDETAVPEGGFYPENEPNDWNARGQPDMLAATEPVNGTGTERRPDLLAGSSEVSPGEQPAVSGAATPIRHPQELSENDRGAGVGNVEPPNSAREPRSEQVALPRTGQKVTGRPDSNGGADHARPDTPAGPRGEGVKSARERIAERSRSNYRITDEDHIGEGGPAQKIRANIDAIRILKSIEDENREATPEEKAKLVKYTGWGAFAQDIFARGRDTYQTERQALRSLLTDEEYEAARGSTLNSHYTSVDVVRGMWDALAHLGYDGGLAIEPSAGVGHFMGLIPDYVAPKTAWTAVELDPVTGRIAKALYGGADVEVRGFETLKRPANYFDLAVSNVPFGDYKLTEKPYGSHSIHNFFFVKALDKVRPGGMVSFITSRYTMDSGSDTFRRMLGKSADLVGAIRLPGGRKGAFAGNAGTEVTTDVLFLRKRVQGEAGIEAPNWFGLKEIDTPEGKTSVNEYFADHPDMMLGEMRLQGTMYRANEPVLVGEAEGLREKIATAAAKMQGDVFAQRITKPPPIAAPEAGEVAGVKEGGYFIKDGSVFRKRDGIAVAHEIGKDAAEKMGKLVGLRDTVNDLLGAQIQGDPAKAEGLRAQYRKAYQAFVDKYGPINKETRTATKRLTKAGEPVTIVRRPNFDVGEFHRDPDAFKVAATEDYDSETDRATPAAIQTRDVISRAPERTIDGPSDALTATLDEKGAVDLQHIGRLMGAGTEEQVIARLGDLIYQNPDGRQWETTDQYLSGNVVKKLEDAQGLAKSDPAFLRNVQALEKVQPTPVEWHDISAPFGAPWIPEDVYGQFLREEVGSGKGTKVSLKPVSKDFHIELDGWSRDAVAKYGTDDMNVKEIVQAAINNSSPRIEYSEKQPDGSKKTVVDEKATQEARIKVKNLRDAFFGDAEAGVEGWLGKDDDRVERLAGIFNRTFNNLAPRKFDGSHLTFPGMSAEWQEKLRPHQRDAVWRSVQNGNTLLAHVVGSGKTATMIASGQEMRRLGLANKPAYVVPNYMLEQFSREFLQTYPGAKILVADREEMAAADRKAFISKVATGDWDGVIMTHNAFGRVPVGQDVRAGFFRGQLDELEQILEEVQGEGKNSPKVKEIERQRKQYQDRLTKLLATDRKDEGTTFEESGVDHIILDEAHKFKNLAFPTRFDRVKGLSTSASQRAEDLYMKIRYLEQNRPGRSALFATGTPISNTMAEMWTMMRYLENDKLRERGLDTFDAWANTFGQITNNMEIGNDGRSLVDVASFSKFTNLPELVSLWAEVADTKLADQLKLPRPDVVQPSGRKGITVVEADPSEQEEAYIQNLVKLAEAGGEPFVTKNGRKGKTILPVITKGRKIAADGRLISPAEFEFNPRGKVAKAVENIARIYKAGTDTAKAQMVFLDLGTPGGAASKIKAARGAVDEDGNPIEGAANPVDDTQFDLYNDIKQRLIDKGVPAKEIAFVHDAKDDGAKAALFGDVRTGKVRVLIGSTEKMGVGTNAQTRLIAMHHIDAPWKPAEVEQRDGRIVRQGNLNPEVQVYRYVTRRSFDSFMWQTLDRKAKFINQVLSGTKGFRQAEDIDSPLPEASQLKAAATGDPRIIEHAEMTRQVNLLLSQKRVFESTVKKADYETRSAQSRLTESQRVLPLARDEAAKAQDLSGDKFKATVAGQDFTERKAAGEKLLSTLLGVQPNTQERMIKIGSFSGFDAMAELQLNVDWDGNRYTRSNTILSTGRTQYRTANSFVLNKETDPVGLMRRFENLLSQIKEAPSRIERSIADDDANITKLSQTMKATWPRGNELREGQAKLDALTTALSKKAPAAAPEKELTQEPEERELEQTAHGKINLKPGEPRATISLFRDANASTFIHETGHDFLEQMNRDSGHPAAPQWLKDDMTTVRQWVGSKGGEFTTRQHEKFARGFEQYLREGTAPTAGLARIFQQFKTWLVQIYRTIKGLGEPIGPEISRVFDRMLTESERPTIVAPTREPGTSLADVHETDAMATPAHEAVPAADRVIAESRQAETEVQGGQQELASRTEHAAETGLRPGEEGSVSNAGVDAGNEPAGGTGGLGSRAELSGGVGPVREGAGLGAGGTGTAARQQPSGAGAGDSIIPKPVARFPEPESGAVDKAGNIRLANLVLPEQLGEALIESADRNGEFKAVRGSMTKGQMMDLAVDLGLRPDAMDIEGSLAKITGKFDNLAKYALALRLLVRQSSQAVYEAATISAREGTDETAAALAKVIARHDMIQSALSGATANWGRSGSAFHNLNSFNGAADLDRVLRENVGRTLFQVKLIGKLIAGADAIPAQVSAIVRDSGKYSFGRMILEYWVNGLISGIPTHVTYSIGNALIAADKIFLEAPVAAAISAARRRAGENVIPFGEAAAQLRGARGAALPAFHAAMEALRTGVTTALPGERENWLTGYSPLQTSLQPGAIPHMGASLNENADWNDVKASWYGMARGLKDAFIASGAIAKAQTPAIGLEYGLRGVIPNIVLGGTARLPIGEAARMPSRFIASVHSFFRALGYSIEINGTEYRQAWGEGHRGDALAQRIADMRLERDPAAMQAASAAGIESPADARMALARSEANEQTLMAPGGKFTQKIAELTNFAPKLPLLGETPILKFIDPFVHISSNILDQALMKRTPLGFLAPTIRADLMGQNGPVAADRALARMLVGSALAITFGALAAEGSVTGAGPTDPKQMATWRLAGYQPHSVKLNDTWYDLHRLGPLGMLLGMSADLYDVAHTAMKEDMLTAAGQLQHAIAQNILDESFMSGPAEFLKAVGDKSYAENQYIPYFLSSFVPYSVGMAYQARAMDPYMRMAHGAIEAMRAKIPGLSQDLLPRRDLWGQPIPNREALGASGLTAVWEQKQSTDPVNIAMMKLGIGKPMPERRLSNVQLTDQQYDDYTRISGVMTKQRLDQYIRSGTFARQSDGDRREAIESIFKACREAARGVMFMKFPSIPAKATALRKAKATGADIRAIGD